MFEPAAQHHRFFLAAMITKTLCGLPLAVMFAAASTAAADVLMLDDPLPPPIAGRAAALNLRGFAGNDMVPAKRFEDEPWPPDYRARKGTNLALAQWRLDLDGHLGAWRMGYFLREDWLVSGNQDTVHAYALAKREALESLARDYDLDYAIRGLRADGLKLGYRWQSDPVQGKGWTAALSLSVMRGLRVRQETARGRLADIAGVATLNGTRRLYQSSLRPLPAPQADGFNDFSPLAPQTVDTGWGHGVDAGLAYVAQNGGRFSLVLNDLFARLAWDRVPLIEQEIVNLSAPMTPGATPAISGRNVYAPLRLRLKPKWTARAELPMGDFGVAATLQGTDGELFPALGVDYAVASGWRLGVVHETRFGGTSLVLRGRRAHLSLGVNALPWGQSRVLAVSAGLAFPL